MFFLKTASANTYGELNGISGAVNFAKYVTTSTNPTTSFMQIDMGVIGNYGIYFIVDSMTQFGIATVIHQDTKQVFTQ